MEIFSISSVGFNVNLESVEPLSFFLFNESREAPSPVPRVFTKSFLMDCRNSCLHRAIHLHVSLWISEVSSCTLETVEHLNKERRPSSPRFLIFQGSIVRFFMG
ncbi:unnamed protein product, partial [Prunus brigantina]